MRANVLTGPAPWAVDRLGFAIAAQLWERLPSALAAAVGRAANAREASRTADQAFADARWPVQYEELSSHLRAIEGVSLARAPRAAHQLVVVRDQVILPWCYGRTGAVSMRDVRPSRSLEQLVRESLHRPRSSRPIVDRADSAPGGELPSRFDQAPTVLIAGYACTADHGLLRVCLGEATVRQSGELDWRHVADLPLPPPSIPRPRRQSFPC